MMGFLTKIFQKKSENQARCDQQRERFAELCMAYEKAWDSVRALYTDVHYDARRMSLCETKLEGVVLTFTFKNGQIDLAYILPEGTKAEMSEPMSFETFEKRITNTTNNLITGNFTRWDPSNPMRNL